MATKYYGKATKLFLKTQSAIGTPATLTATDAISASDLASNTEYKTTAYEYNGAIETRDGFVAINDTTATCTGKVFLPALGAPATSASEWDIADLFEMAGFTGDTTPDTETVVITFPSLTAAQFVTVGGLTFTSTAVTTAANVAAAFASLADGAVTGGGTANGAYSGALTGFSSGAVTGTSTVTFTATASGQDVTDIVISSTTGVTVAYYVNQPAYVLSNETLNSVRGTVAYAMSSPDVATEKVYELQDGVAVLDVMVEISKISEVTFTINGNFVLPSQDTAIIPDFGNQRAASFILPVVSSTNLTTSEIVWESAGTIAAKTPGTKNICFKKFQSSNISGVSTERYLSGCEDGFSKLGVGTDVVLTIMEPSADASFVPENRMGEYARVTIAYGNTAGRRVMFEFTRLQLKNIARTDDAGINYQDLTFDNRGYVRIYAS